ncbi:hypothetical protein HHI36_021990 [Cryptolaemus montrouzieri]|uniref:Phorbol-ester/DAG-type domain-containing protein n=1 Tax=Cryptolaemus montrouzieri TaxID=559131 RepID=A0ABD2MZ59_9CUCU
MAASSSLENQQWTCNLCNHIIISRPITCLVCDNNYHEGCAKKIKGTFIGKCEYVCKKCDNEYFSEVQHLLESDAVTEETKNVVILLVKIIESKDEIIASKNYYIKLLQTKVSNLQNKLKTIQTDER